MQKYIYKACDNKFNIVKSEIEEEDIGTAKEKLKAKGLKIIDIKRKISLEDIKLGKENLKDGELAAFCGQIAIILNSGVSIIKGLEVLELQVKNKTLKNVVSRVLLGVRRGRTLAGAMADTKAFPTLLTDMVASGELSGNIDSILFNMEEFYNREASIKSRIKSASIYPIVMLVVCIGMMLFFNFFIFSELKDLFADGANLPVITKVVLGTMGYLNTNFIQCIFVFSGVVILIAYIKKLESVKYWLDIAALKYPLIGEVKNNIITSRFTRSMGIFLKSAVPILSVLDSMQLIVGNSYIAQKVSVAKTGIINGTSIADSFEQQGIFEPMVIQMMRVGEETGKLEEMLYKLADIYDKRVETGITRLMALIEPMFTLIIGIVVGTVIIAMAMPVMQMSQTVR